MTGNIYTQLAVLMIVTAITIIMARHLLLILFIAPPVTLRDLLKKPAK